MSESDSDDSVDHFQYKVLVLGDGAVGKTSLINRFCDGLFKESYKQTIGLDFFVKRVSLPGNVQTTLQIWDIGGQQLGSRMLGNYLYGSHCIVLVYDITNLESFKNLEQWLEFVRECFRAREGEKKAPHIALVGNKMDLNHLRAVKAEKHSSFAADNTMAPFFVSAKTGDKINAMFTKVAADLAGVQLTKSELDVADMVVQANIVNHPKPTQAEDITTIEADQRKKKDCCVM
ncbi:Ras-related protein Rab-6 [Diplonema papillatum]|nr:Ras-related protein Rab-6 [Diplonema papillatum]